MDKNIKIVRYKREFKEAVIKFFNSLAYEDLYNRFHGSIKDFDNYIENWNKKRGIVLIAFYNSQVIGVCEAYPVNDEWETAIIIARDFRRHGIGRRLLEEISNAIAKEGGKAIYGIIHRSNRGAIEFGRRVGCKIADLDSQTVKVYFSLCNPI